MRRVLLAVCLVVLALSGCSDDGSTHARQTPEVIRNVFWPAKPAEIAIVGKSDWASGDMSRIAATDGKTFVELKKLDHADAFARGGHFLAFGSAYGAARIGVIDLDTGKIATAACHECGGVALVGGHIVSVDQDFKMHVFDTSMRSPVVVAIDHVSEASIPDQPHDRVIPTVIGALDGRVVVSYLTTNGIARGGPEVVSLYGVDGALGTSWTVDGRIYGTQIDAGRSRLVLAVGGSGSACTSIAVPEVIEPTQPRPVVLVPNPGDERKDLTYFASDLWWNGDQIAAFGLFVGQQDVKCVTEYVFRRFDLHGQLDAAPTHGVASYRFLGPGCDHALIVESRDERSKLYEVHDSSRRELARYDSVLWTDARAQRCPTFPGLSN